MRTEVQVHDIDRRLYWSTTHDDPDHNGLRVEEALPFWLSRKVTKDLDKQWFARQTVDTDER